MKTDGGATRTSDMTLAAVLTCHGYRLTMEVDDHSKMCTWVIPPEDVPATQELILNYVDGRARVEPRRFMREVRYIRKQVYKAIGHEAPRVAPSV